jgi:hypothetical protein
VVPEIEWQRNPANSSAGWTHSTPVPSPVSDRCLVLFAASQARIPTTGLAICSCFPHRAKPCRRKIPDEPESRREIGWQTNRVWRLRQTGVPPTRAHGRRQAKRGQGDAGPRTDAPARAFASFGDGALSAGSGAGSPAPGRRRPASRSCRAARSSRCRTPRCRSWCRRHRARCRPRRR